MAKKGQKFMKYTDEERTEIFNQYLSGKGSYRSIAKERGISWKTVEGIIRKYRQTGLSFKEKRGRSKEKDLTKEDWKQRYEILKKYQAFLKAQREKK